MSVRWTRRRLLVGTSSFIACSSAPPPVAPSTYPTGALRTIRALEMRTRGRVGVFAVDTGTARELAYRADERFAMCSTFKWLLAAHVLELVDRGQLALDERVSYAESDLLEYAPVARRHAADGFLTIEALARAAVTVSDNTAANLLLARIGGPASLTAFAGSFGDKVTRLDRNEPTLNSNDPGDPRDTTSPRAMVGLMRAVLCGNVLSSGGRGRLLGWLRDCETGKDRLRAGFPADWVVGDKTDLEFAPALPKLVWQWPGFACARMTKTRESDRQGGQCAG